MKKVINAATGFVKEAGGVAKTFSKNDQVSSRHQRDMLSDNRLSKNARPIALFWMLGLLTLGIVLSCFKITIPKEFQDAIFWGVSLTLAFYFGGRSLEKYKVSNVKLEERTEKLERREKKREGRRWK